LRETVALCRMADELLSLARLDREASIERAPVNLSALVREVAEAVEPLVQARNLTLRTSLDDDVFVDGNRDHLQRLLINLLDNALKFTPEHGRVSVGLNIAGAQAILRVADNGPGIPPDDLPFIFDRFFRGKNRAEHGSGLGLSLCREIVRLHGGKISAANGVDGGGEFVVMLPASKPVQV
jgi:signal transduction histidine kinase